MPALCLGYAVLAFSFSLAQWSVILEVYDQNDAGGQRDSNAGRTVNQAIVSKMLQVPAKEQSCAEPHGRAPLPSLTEQLAQNLYVTVRKFLTFTPPSQNSYPL
jgi:hypothetical protein